jgi:hypothetical protein
MEYYNIISLHPTKQALVLDSDFADYLLEQSWDTDQELGLDKWPEFAGIYEDYVKEESK